ncbi:MAG: hypothetical protein FWG91_10080 [Lachnospiraceae bacterium]|nr:hypothetical protein [Lachnospiraceae bacterium]
MKNKKDKIKKSSFWSDNSGASLLFVLGITLFLLAIGVSLMVAASTNAGYLSNQREFSQIKILDESIHRTIMYSLQDNENYGSLGFQLAMALYETHLADEELPREEDPLVIYDAEDDEHDEGIVISGLDFADEEVTIRRVILSFPDQWVNIYNSESFFEWLFEDETADPRHSHIPWDSDEFEWFEWADEEEIDDEWLDEDDLLKGIRIWTRIPNTALINAAMNVTVEILAANSGRERTVTSRAVYEYSDGFLSDAASKCDICDGLDDDCQYILIKAPDDDDYLMSFSAGNFGIWDLVGYENIETEN